MRANSCRPEPSPRPTSRPPRSASCSRWSDAPSATGSARGGYPQLLDDYVAPALAACVRLSVQPMLDIRTGPYGSTAPRSDCFEPADEEQCTARLRALRRRARTLLHRMSEWLDAHAGEHPEYQPRENIFKRCTIDGNLVQIH